MNIDIDIVEDTASGPGLPSLNRATITKSSGVYSDFSKSLAEGEKDCASSHLIFPEEEKVTAPTGPIGMAAVGKTMVYPRKDNIFKKKESLPFDEVNSLVWQDRPFQKRKEQTKTWLAHFLVGLFVGTIAFLMILLEEKINEHVIEYTQHLISADKTAWFAAGMFYAGMAAIFASSASLMTTYYGTGASGSGVAELIGYMNGVNYPDFIGIRTLITKILGVIFAITGKLCVGKEGPLAHIGANIGILVLYIPGLGFEFLRNDEKKRQFIAAGASAGVSAAFGAPIGGALFAYEMSKPNTFWKFTMIWKVFFSCSVGNLVLAILISLKSGIF
jgi:chloride channel 7